LKDLKINRTPKTPLIDFNVETGVLLIAGVSVPENSMEFYGNLINWLKNYVNSPVKKTTVVFKLAYVNTSSLQFIYDFLMLLDEINGTTSDVKIEWFYLEEDIDMKEMGEDFREALSIDFSFFGVETIE